MAIILRILGIVFGLVLTALAAVGVYTHKVINWNDGGKTHSFKIFAWTIVFGWYGNCNQRVLQFHRGLMLNPKMIQITYRSKNRRETNIYLHGLKPWHWCWNSEWIAFRFGEYQDSSDGGYPDMYQYNGKFGCHTLI